VNKPKTYQSRSMKIQAMQWDGSDFGAKRIIDWVVAYHRSHEESASSYYSERGPRALLIRTPKVTIQARSGDWIVLGHQGKFQTFKPDLFADLIDGV
jgi:peptidase E